MTDTSAAVEPSVKQVSEDSPEGQLLRRLLEEERTGTANYLKYDKKGAEWKKYRDERRAAIQRLMGGATKIKIGELLVASSEPKDQFSGTRFRDEYPALYEEFTRIRAESFLDVEALAAAHPEIADRFTVRTFQNRAS